MTLTLVVLARSHLGRAQYFGVPTEVVTAKPCVLLDFEASRARDQAGACDLDLTETTGFCLSLACFEHKRLWP